MPRAGNAAVSSMVPHPIGLSDARLAGRPIPPAASTERPPWPPLPGALRERLPAALAEGGPLGLFWVNLAAFPLFVKLYGGEAGEQVMERLRDLLDQTCREVIPTTKFLHLERVDHSSLLALFQDGPLAMEGLLERTLNLRVALRHRLNRELVRATGQSLAVEVGCAILPATAGGDLERRLLNAVADARQVAEGILDQQRLALMAEFHELVERPALHAVYQPLLDLGSGAVMGWEALARGPRGGYFASPEVMFDFAEEVGSLFLLERACRQAALAGLGGLGPGQKLFINLHPHTLGDPGFKAGETRRLLARHGLKPADVVFEITERHSIHNFALFHRALEHYRSQGFGVAIDDVGTGYSGLSRIAQLRPDFLKADRSLVRGVDTNPLQRALLETLVTFADKIGCAIIAEGIETATELSSLIAMGVHYGQGYYIARPEAPKPQPKVSLPFRSEDLRRAPSSWKCSIPVRQLAEYAPQVAKTAKVREVKTLLDSHPISGVVVVEAHRPLGLVMSHSLDRQLGTRYGSALYYDREVGLVMDPEPLMVEGGTPVEMVAKAAMGRDRFKLYDHIIVTENGATTGVVSVQKMLDALARVQVEMAKGASPLTGLPGNVALETELERRVQEAGPASIIYADLDNFKAYNDSYGFESGDRMIRLVSDVLQWATRRHGGKEAFLGHIGGDDFVVITAPERAERLSRAVVRVFARLVRRLYAPEDLARGHVLAKGRDGQPGRFPLVTVSLAIVDCLGRCGLHEIGQRAAEVKRFAKSQPGNVFVRDRRRPLGAAPAPEDLARAG